MGPRFRVQLDSNDVTWLTNKILCLALLVVGLSQLAVRAQTDQARPRLAPIVATERVGAGVVRIVYDLNDQPDARFTVTIEASNDGGKTFAIRPRSTTGDVGPNVAPGAGKAIEWDSTKDIDDLQLERFVFRVLASPATAIQQTNVAPSAAASRRGSAGVGKTGGLSRGVIAGIAGAAAAGTIVAVKVAKSNQPPAVSSVSATPTTALVGTDTPIVFSVTASDQDNGPQGLTFSWDFGDGGTTTGANPSHVYAIPGTFTVRVNVSDGKDSASGQTTVAIRTLTGTWRSNSVDFFGPNQWILNLTQTGTSVSGFATGTRDTTTFGTIANGEIRSTSSRVTLPFNNPNSFFFLDPSADVDTLSGIWYFPSTTLSQAIIFTRQ